MKKKKGSKLTEFLMKHVFDIPIKYWKPKLQPAIDPKGPLHGVATKKKKVEKLNEALKRVKRRKR